MPEPTIVMTIEDDDDIPLEVDSDDEEVMAQKPKKKAAKSKAKAKANGSFNKDFVFRADETGLSNGAWNMDGATRQLDQRQSVCFACVVNGCMLRVGLVTTLHRLPLRNLAKAAHIHRSM